MRISPSVGVALNSQTSATLDLRVSLRLTPLTASTFVTNGHFRFIGYHRATCTNRPTWLLRRQVVWYRFQRHSWATQPPSPRHRSSTSIRTRRQPLRLIRALRTTSPRHIRTPPRPRLVRVWIVSRARVATIRYTTTNTTSSNNKTDPVRRWRISNGWRKLSYRNFCRPCCVITVEDLKDREGR